MDNIDAGTPRAISELPLNYLFNISLISKQNVWEIDLETLLNLLLRLLDSKGNRDLRICGTAALSSSLIYRLKVESIFQLEKMSIEKKPLDRNIKTIPQLEMLDLPFRFEPTYPISVEDLIKVLESMLSDLANPKPRKKLIEINPVQTFDFDQYLIKFEEIILEYENLVLETIKDQDHIFFSYFASKHKEIELARYFIAILFLASKRKVKIENFEDDFMIIKTNNTNV